MSDSGSDFDNASNAGSNAGSSGSRNSRGSRSSKRGGRSNASRASSSRKPRRSGGKAKSRQERLDKIRKKQEKTKSSSSTKSSELSPDGIRAALSDVVGGRLDAAAAQEYAQNLLDSVAAELRFISDAVEDASGFVVGPNMDLSSGAMWCPAKIGYDLIDDKFQAKFLADIQKANKKPKKKSKQPEQYAPAAYVPQKGKDAAELQALDEGTLDINAAFHKVFKDSKDAVENTSPTLADMARRIALALYNAPADYKKVMTAVLTGFRKSLAEDSMGVGLLAVAAEIFAAHLPILEANRVLIDEFEASSDSVGFVDPKMKTANLPGREGSWTRYTKTAILKKATKPADAVKEYLSELTKSEIDLVASVNMHAEQMQKGFPKVTDTQVKLLHTLSHHLNAMAAGKGGQYHTFIKAVISCLQYIDADDGFLVISPHIGDLAIEAGIIPEDEVKKLSDIFESGSRADVISLAYTLVSSV